VAGKSPLLFRGRARPAKPEMHFASFVPEFGEAYLSVLINETSGDEFRLVLGSPKISADFSDCMRES
jgi:hypothetical protein